MLGKLAFLLGDVVEGELSLLCARGKLSLLHGKHFALFDEHFELARFLKLLCFIADVADLRVGNLKIEQKLLNSRCSLHNS